MDDQLLNLSVEDLRNKLLSTTDNQELTDLVSLFNLNLKKKEIVRADVLSDLQDKLAQQMEQRIQKHSDTFSNRDLLEYLNAIQAILNKQTKTVEGPAPTIAIQNNVVISDNTQELDKDSRDKVTDLIKNILKQQQADVFIDEPDVVEQGE